MDDFFVSNYYRNSIKSKLDKIQLSRLSVHYDRYKIFAKILIRLDRHFVESLYTKTIANQNNKATEQLEKLFGLVPSVADFEIALKNNNPAFVERWREPDQQTEDKDGMYLYNNWCTDILEQAVERKCPLLIKHIFDMKWTLSYMAVHIFREMVRKNDIDFVRRYLDTYGIQKGRYSKMIYYRGGVDLHILYRLTLHYMNKPIGSLLSSYIPWWYFFVGAVKRRG